MNASRDSKKAALFDLDGTLLDTINDLADAMNSVLAEAGLPTPPVEVHKYCVGDGVYNYLTRALPADRRGDKELIARLMPRYRQAYAANWANKTRPYDGIPEMLHALRERGVRLAVLSNKPDDFTREMMDHYFPPALFELVRGALDDVPLKPNPQAALAIAEEMGLAPQEFLYLGDTATDMRTAVSAGMFAVGALWGFRTLEELSDAGAQKLIEHPSEFLMLL